MVILFFCCLLFIAIVLEQFKLVSSGYLFCFIGLPIVVPALVIILGIIWFYLKKLITGR